VESVVSANEEAVGAWDGVLYDRFVQYRDVIIPALEPFGEEALRLSPPREGERALDIGCGFGDTTQRIAGLVGPAGLAVGVDAASRFIATARQEAAEAGVENAEFIVGDIQAVELPGPFDYAFSRMGTMFLANPAVAFRNVRGAMRPGGRLAIAVWRRKLENEWMYQAEVAVEEWLEEEEDTDELTCGPGPFAQANADTVSGQLVSADFEEISLRRHDMDMMIGNDLEHAVAYVCALGPAAEAIRLSGEQGKELRPQMAAAVRKVLEPYRRADGSVWGPITCWIVTATVPA
jgi:SAM-dependent methyltransferase